MWEWTQRNADRLLASIDSGTFFRKPWQWFYLLVFIVLVIYTVVGPLASFGAGCYGAYEAYGLKAYAQGVQGLSSGLLLGIAIGLTGLLGLSILWKRMDSLQGLTDEGNRFITMPLVAHIIRTAGEFAGAMVAVFGVLSFLALWPARQLVGSMPMVDDVLVSIPGILHGSGLASPLVGFGIIFISRWLSEALQVVFSVANDTRALRDGRVGMGAPAMQPMQAVAADTFKINWELVGLGALAYLLIALPLDPPWVLAAAAIALAVALNQKWWLSAALLLATTGALAIGLLVQILAQDDPISLSAHFHGRFRPLLILLFVLLLASAIFLFLERSRWVVQTAGAGRASLIGLGVLLLVLASPIISTVREASLRHELTTEERATALGLLKDFQDRAFCWYAGEVADTNQRFILEGMQVESDVYGNLFYTHEFPAGDRTMEAHFKGTYRDIHMPQELIYHDGGDSISVRYINGDSIALTDLENGKRFGAVARDVLLARSRDTRATAERILVAQVDSLNRIVDTLAGYFKEYSCADGQCFAWFDAEQDDGSLRLLGCYCPTATISGLPMATLPKDHTKWTLVTRKTLLLPQGKIPTPPPSIAIELTALLPPIQKVEAIKTLTPDGAGSESIQELTRPAAPVGKVYVEKEVDVAPSYPGGFPAYLAYLRNSLQFPPGEQMIITKVKVSFIITKAGTIKEVDVDKSTKPAFAEEAIRAIRNMPLWYPGQKDGKSVDVRMTEIVEFKQ